MCLSSLFHHFLTPTPAKSTDTTLAKEYIPLPVMSCSQVMYQPYQPYSSYFPYPQRPSTAGHQSTASLFGGNNFASMDSTRTTIPFSDTSSSTLVSNNQNHISSGVSSRKLIDSSPPPSTTTAVKDESSPKQIISNLRSGAGERASTSSAGSVGSKTAAGDLRDSAADAQYISANCVVFTYFSGDTSSVVDQHFSRALSQQTYSSSDKPTKEGTVPMSQRSFPPSFWNINHQPVLTAHHHSSHTSSSSGLCIPTPGTSSAAQVHELYASAAAADAYHHTGALHPSIHHQNDPWHYTLSATAAANPYSAHHHHHRAAAASAAAIHDLSSYSSASNRFNAQYSSLLLQPASMRSTRLTPVSATCTGFDKTAPDMSWPTSARYHHDSAMNFAGHPSIDPSNYSASAAYGAAMSAAMSGLESPVQESSKDLYWF